MSIKIRFEDDFNTYCSTWAFKQAVRQAVEDREYLTSWRNRLDIENTVHTKVTNEINNYKLTVDTLTRNAVAYEMKQQMPQFLSQSHEMTSILDTHKKSVTGELDKHAHDLLDKIVNEEKYHTINKMYFAAFEQKCDNMITSEKNKIENTITDLNSKCNDTINKLGSEIKKIDKLEKKLEQYKQNSWIFGSVAMFCGIVIGGLIFSIKNI